MKQPQIADYFEGILQIRHGNPELLDWIRKKVKQDGRARISKEKKTPNGIDLYMTNQHYLQNLGLKIKQKFNGILKVSRRLHTQHKMTSKMVYRVNVLFIPLNVKRGDLLTIHGEEVEVLQVGTKARVKVLKSGQKKEVDLDTIRRAIK